MSNRKTEFSPRRRPLQKRAKESVETILAAAAALLDEVGIDGFNTNLLANHAGVRVRTIYRYFPNKYSVIFALTKKLAESWDEWLADYYEALSDPQHDWREAIVTARSEWLRNARRTPGSVSVLQATQATLELRELHDAVFQDMCRKLAGALKARKLDLPEARLMAIARAIVSSENAATDVYFRLKSSQAEAFLGEINRYQISYLETYLGTGSSSKNKRLAEKERGWERQK